MNLKFLYSENFFIFTIAFIAILFNLLPYLYEQKVDHFNKTYIDGYPILVDKPTYLAEMSQGEDGNWKMINKFTTEPQKPVFVYTFYIFLGHIAKLFNIPNETFFLLSRFLFGMILMITIIYFIRQFIENENQRKLAYFLAFFSSGLAGIIPIQQNFNFWVLDAIPIIKFSHFPHMTFANALLLIIFILIYKSFTSKKIIPAIAAGIIGFFLNLILPYHSILVYAVIILFLAAILIKNKFSDLECLLYAIVFFIISSPSFFYLIYLVKFNPFWEIINKNSIYPPPSLIELLSDFGLLLIFALLGTYEMYKRKNEYFLFFFLWIFTALFLTYLPFIQIQQKRILETGLYLPLAIMASFGIESIYRYLKNKRIENIRLKFIVFFIIFIAPLLLINNIQNWLQIKELLDSTDNKNIYIDNTKIEAMRWLRQNSLPNNIIFSSYYTGNLIPYYANRYAYIGHWAMTINFEEKNIKVENFYSGKYSTAEMFDFLKKEKINYIFYSDEERKLGNFNSENYNFLKLVYQNNKTEIYKVEQL